MKNIITFFTVLLSINITYAQFVTEGDGTNYSMEMLADAAGSQFEQVNNHYEFSGEITIAAGDTLSILTGDSVYCNTDALLRIEGVMQAMPPEPAVFAATDSAAGFEGFTFDESTGSVLQNLHFCFSGGVKLMYADVHIKNCRFYKTNDLNGSGAVNMLSSNPVIENCTFLYCLQSAISSGANSASSPLIKNNYLYHNNTENGNRPQINLGTSAENESIIIRGNTITGYYDETGGVSLATLAGGTITAVVDSNLINNNRYGLNVQGDVEVDIMHNRFIDNNIEDNPMYGGSGISFYSGAEATVAHNIITGNLWGITIPNEASPNIGQIGDDTVNIGHNYIFNNENSGNTYNLYNNSSQDIYAQNNYWGTTSVDEAAEGIIDNADDPALGEVFYEPIYLLSSQKQITTFRFEVSDSLIDANIDEANNLITTTLPYGTDLTALAPIFEISRYATLKVDGNVQQSGVSVQDFTDSVQYTVMAEDSSTADYIVHIQVASGIAESGHAAIKTYPNPVYKRLNIETTHQPQSFVLYDISGKIIRYQSTHKQNTVIQTAHLPAGIYILHVRFANDDLVTHKIIKKQTKD